MQISENGIKFIKDVEGLKLEAYLCPANKWTIGFGHTGDVKKGDKITLNKAKQLLKQDLEPIEKELSKLVLKQNQYDALCSFILNIGLTNFRSSTMKKFLVEKKYDLAQTQFKRWKYITQYGVKVVSTGLVNRRKKEEDLFSKEE